VRAGPQPDRSHDLVPSEQLQDINEQGALRLQPVFLLRIFFDQVPAIIVAFQNVGGAELSPRSQEFAPGHTAVRIRYLGELLRLGLELAMDFLRQRAHR
jgi:hypothetical protein